MQHTANKQTGIKSKWPEKFEKWMTDEIFRLLEKRRLGKNKNQKTSKLNDGNPKMKSFSLTL